MLYEVAKELIILGEERREQWFAFLERCDFKREDYVHIISLFLEEDIDCNYEYMKLDTFITFINNNIDQLQKGDFLRETIADMLSDVNEDDTVDNDEIIYKIWVVEKFFKDENLW